MYIYNYLIGFLRRFSDIRLLETLFNAMFETGSVDLLELNSLNSANLIQIKSFLIVSMYINTTMLILVAVVVQR